MKILKSSSLKAKAFVFVQFISLLILAWSGQSWPSQFYLRFLLIFALLNGVWAVVAKRFNVSALPVPSSDMVLIFGGPYKYIRHPMYLSLCLYALVTIIAKFSYAGAIAGVVLLVNLHLKMNYEEKLLVSNYKEYENYKNATWRLIPYVF